jgi:ATP-dependent protease Clp ATPase subunit
VAELAADEKTGARGLMTVCERIFRDFKFELPSTVVKQIVVSRGLVDDPAATLRGLLAEQAKEEREVMKQVVREFADRFRESFGLTLNFDEDAAEHLVTLALDQRKTVRDVCAEKFKNFQFGLRLVSQSTGQTEFKIDRSMAENPEKTLSEWVVATYRRDG